MKSNRIFAFPIFEAKRADADYDLTEPGMTLRDYFAAQALNRFARPTHPKHDPCHQLGINARDCIAWDAKVAYAYADAMLEEREKNKNASNS